MKKMVQLPLSDIKLYSGIWYPQDCGLQAQPSPRHFVYDTDRLRKYMPAKQLGCGFQNRGAVGRDCAQQGADRAYSHSGARRLPTGAVGSLSQNQ
jgi:hypothetical protein